jgi:hypothetical protein
MQLSTAQGEIGIVETMLASALKNGWLLMMLPTRLQYWPPTARESTPACKHLDRPIIPCSGASRIQTRIVH